MNLISVSVNSTVQDVVCKPVINETSMYDPLPTEFKTYTLKTFIIMIALPDNLLLCWAHAENLSY